MTPAAKTQFLDALIYIWEGNPSASNKFAARAFRVLDRLRIFPDSGRRIPEYPDKSHREVIVRPYRFFYRTTGSTVWVVNVWHEAQLPGRPDT